MNFYFWLFVSFKPDTENRNSLKMSFYYLLIVNEYNFLQVNDPFRASANWANDPSTHMLQTDQHSAAEIRLQSHR